MMPIVFASGYAETVAIERFAANSAMLRKPFRMEELQSVLAEVLRQRLVKVRLGSPFRGAAWFSDVDIQIKENLLAGEWWELACKLQQLTD